MEDNNLMLNEQGNKSNVINIIPFFLIVSTHTEYVITLNTEKINLEVYTQKVILWLSVDFHYLPLG